MSLGSKSVRKSPYQLVQEFHEVFGFPRPSQPTLLSEKAHAFRSNFHFEELEETIKAVQLQRFLDAADGVVDLAYVLYGTLDWMGCHDNVPAYAFFDKRGPGDNPRPLVIYAAGRFEALSYTLTRFSSIRGLRDMPDGWQLHTSATLCRQALGFTLALANEMNLPFVELFEEVHAANMRKARANQAGDDRSHRVVDFDVVKPVGWRGPDIRGVLRRFGCDERVMRQDND